MAKRVRFFSWLGVLLPGLAVAPAVSAAHPVPLPHRVAAPYPVSDRHWLPGLGFEPNRGQASRPVRFFAHGPTSTLFLLDGSMLLRSSGGATEVARIRFAGSNRRPRMIAWGRLPARVSYFLGSNPHFWRRGIPTYAHVEYRDIYPGIDLRLDWRGGQLHDDWRLSPGARVTEIHLKIFGRRSGIHRLLPLAGGLVSYLGRGTRHTIPLQVRLGTRGNLRLRLRSRLASFHSDFTLGYSTSLGGSSFDFATGVAVDIAGSAYIVGSTGSPDFPTSHSIVRNLNPGGDGEDGFVAKLNSAGTALLYATYLGGSGDDEVTGIAVTGGSAYITGFTRSADFPTRNPLPADAGGSCGKPAAITGQAFVARLNQTGTVLRWSTCLGGRGATWGSGIAVKHGRVYVIGSTMARNLPAVRAAQRENAGGTDAFIAALDRRGTGLLYCTYLGGSRDEQGTGIAVDAGGNLYVTGSTDSTNFPTRGALQSHFAGGSSGTSTGDAFVTKLNPAGRIVYSTYLGGTLDDAGMAIAADGAGSAFVTGITQSTDFPVDHAVQAGNRGGSDAFVTAIDPAGSSFLYSTYLGGTGNDGGHGIALDGKGNASVTGFTASRDFPLTHPLFSTYHGGVYYGDAFVFQIGPAGMPRFSTYLGGSGADVGMGIAVGRAGAIYVAGGTSSRDFPARHPLSRQPPLRGNAFLTRIIAAGG